MGNCLNVPRPLLPHFARKALSVERGWQSCLPQSFETVIAHVAAYKLGAIALPLALLFGADAMEYRLQDSGAQVLVTNAFWAIRRSPKAAAA